MNTLNHSINGAIDLFLHIIAGGAASAMVFVVLSALYLRYLKARKMRNLD